MRKSKRFSRLSTLVLSAAWVVSAGYAQPPGGTYEGATSQGRPFSLEVSGGQIVSWSFGWTCSPSAGSVNVGTSCAIATDGTFACGSTFCAPFTTLTAIAGAFSGITVSGDLDLATQPNQFSACCQLSNVAFDAILAEIFSDGFESGDLTSWSSSL